ncbi:hypothetical protein BX600DRAFT_467373 [Xylariales sp. PMI_506]|nr:hypothetical protein BX600DRAFT_467373 [Xylariales sp. PMI_506]
MEPGRSSVAGSSRDKWAKPEDWARYRNTITALYMCHSLPNVIRMMREDHGFYATPKMYQVQIFRRWGLRKGRPAAEPKGKKKRRLNEANLDSDSPSGQAAHVTPPEDEDDDDFSNLPDDEDDEDPDPEPRSQPTQQPRQAPSEADSASVASGSLHPHQSWGPQHGVAAEPVQQQNDNILNIPQIGANNPDLSIPLAWTDFLSAYEGPPPLPLPPPGQSLFAFAGGTDSQGATPIHHGQPIPYVDSMNQAGGPSSGSWMTTVMIRTPPHGSNQQQSPQFMSSSESAGVTNSSVATPASSSQQRSKILSSRRSRPSSKTTVSRVRSKASSSTSGSSRSSTATLNLPMETLRHLQSPDALLLPERSMFYARHYISSAFSTGLWSLSQSADPTLLDHECVKLDGWYNNFNPGLDFLSERRVKKAFRIFRRCFAATKEIIEPQDPRVVIYICQQAIKFMFYDTLGRSLTMSLLRYVTGLCRELFTEQHPLYIFLSQIARMDNFEFAQNIRPLMECYFDHLEPFINEKSEAFGFINDLRGLTVSLMEATHMMGIYEAKPVLERLAVRAEEHGHCSLHLRNEIAAALQRNRFFVEARDMLIQLRSTRQAQKNPYEYVYSGLILMVTLRRMKDKDACIHMGYEMVEYLSDAQHRAESEFNNELFKSNAHSSLLLCLGKLETDLRDAGRGEEADQIHARLEAAMNAQYGIEEESAQVVDMDADMNQVTEAVIG